MGASRQRPDRLGEKLAAVRDKSGLSLADLATRLSDDNASVSRTDIYKFEIGQRDPSLIILLRYARFSKVKMEIFADDKLDLP